MKALELAARAKTAPSPAVRLGAACCGFASLRFASLLFSSAAAAQQPTTFDGQGGSRTRVASEIRPSLNRLTNGPCPDIASPCKIHTYTLISDASQANSTAPMEDEIEMLLGQKSRAVPRAAPPRPPATTIPTAPAPPAPAEVRHPRDYDWRARDSGR